MALFNVSNDSHLKYSPNKLFGDASGEIVFNLPSIITSDGRTCIPYDNGTITSCLPQIISPGVQKAGTTFVYKFLTHHPNVAKTLPEKELNYFLDGAYLAGVEHYAREFITNSSLINLDFTPRYFMVPESAELIYKTNRATRFIVLLRDPVERAYSHFRYQQILYARKNGNSTCSDRLSITFKQYLMEEYKILKSCHLIDKHVNPPTWTEVTPRDCKTWLVPHKDSNSITDCEYLFPLEGVSLTKDTSVGYISHGLYVNHIEHYLKYFPMKNFLFIRYEDLQERGEVTVLNEIAEWMGIEPLADEEWGEMKFVNQQEHGPMNPDEEEFLINLYKKPNEQLYKILGRDMEWK